MKHPERKGNRIMIHQKYCYKIGGIETANMSIAKAFRDRNIVFVFGSGDPDQIMALGKYHDVIIDDGAQTYDVDVSLRTTTPLQLSWIASTLARFTSRFTPISML